MGAAHVRDAGRLGPGSPGHAGLRHRRRAAPRRSPTASARTPPPRPRRWSTRRDVDAVVVASPGPTHAELALACLAAGKPVAVREAAGVTADEARGASSTRRSRWAAGWCRSASCDVSTPASVELRERPSRRLASARPASCTASTATRSHIRASTDGRRPGDRLDDPRARQRAAGCSTTRSWASASSRRSLDGLAATRSCATRVRAAGGVVTVEVFVNAGYGYDVRVRGRRHGRHRIAGAAHAGGACRIAGSAAARSGATSWRGSSSPTGSSWLRGPRRRRPVRSSARARGTAMSPTSSRLQAYAPWPRASAKPSTCPSAPACTHDLHLGGVRRDGVHRAAAAGAGRADPCGGVRCRDLGLDRQGPAALAATGATFTSMTGYVDR